MMIGTDLIVQVRSLRIPRRGDRKRGHVRSAIVRESRFARQKPRGVLPPLRRVETRALLRLFPRSGNRAVCRQRRIRRPVRHAGSDQRVERRLILKARVRTSNLVVHETQRKYEALCE